MTKRIIRFIVKTINGVCIACLLFVGVSTLAPVAAQNSTATPTPAGSNLALGKSASQSSTLDGKQAGYAVDGNTDGAITNNSVSSTQMNAQAWWQVDLGANYNLTDVRIWNRTDAGTESRLSNFYVLVSNVPFTSTDLTTALNQAGVSGFQVSGTAGRPDTISVNRSGRYVRVQLAGTDFLNLAEVEVFVSGQGPTPTATLTPTITPTATMTPYPAPVNVALGKTASQSSIHLTYGASLAIDNNTDGNYNHGSVTSTENDANAWWQVDLGAVYALTEIKIWNRTDCCSDRLSNFYVLFSDIPFISNDINIVCNQFGVTCYFISGTAGTPTIVSANHSARYIRVQLSGTNYLSIAEVQAFSTGLASTYTPTNTPTSTPTPNATPVNIAVGKTTSQSSIHLTYGSSLAVDGNTNGNYTLGSVTATESDTNAWWQVDLGAVYSLTEIKIWNRTDCCSDRLSNFYVLVSDVPFTSTDLNTANGQVGVSSYYFNGAAGSPSTIAINRSGRYIRIQLTSANYLSLAEVQVFSSGLASQGMNIAIGKNTRQSSLLVSSSTSFLYGGSLAVDGNVDGVLLNRSVSSTNSDYQAWWQVDLGALYSITSLNVWNRSDNSQSRLSNFYVLVSDVPFNSTDLTTARNQPGVSSYYFSGTAGNPSAVVINRTGRYVRIQLTATNYLSLTEIQVFSTGLATSATDILVGKTATQSSTYISSISASTSFPCNAMLAVNGNIDSIFSNRSSSSTNNDYQAWWQVDMGAIYSLTDIKVWNRTDCCSDRLSNFYVLVSNVPFNSTDLTATRNQSGVSSFYVSGVAGTPSAISINRSARYIRIQLSGTNYLTIAEVQAFSTGLTQ